MALLYASKELDSLPTANFDQKIGVQIIQNALKVYSYALLMCDLPLSFSLCCFFLAHLIVSFKCMQHYYLLTFLLFVLYVKAPVHTIASNAGVEGAVIVGKLLEQDNPDLGYDAAKGISILQPHPFLYYIVRLSFVMKGG